MTLCLQGLLQLFIFTLSRHQLIYVEGSTPTCDPDNLLQLFKEVNPLKME